MLGTGATKGASVYGVESSGHVVPGDPRPVSGNRGVSDDRDGVVIGKPGIAGRAAGDSRSLSKPSRLP